MEEATLSSVSRFVGRELAPGESATYPDLDALPAEVTDLVAVLVMRHCSITAGRYLYERVPGCDRRDIEYRTEQCAEAWMARWSPDDELEARAALGRELRPEEMVTFEGMEIPRAIHEVLVKLAARDFTLGCKYLVQRAHGIHLWGAISWLNRLLGWDD